MADNLADRLRNLAQEHAKGKQAEEDQQKFQERVRTFISDGARPEFENLVLMLKQRSEQLNSNLGDLPKFVPGSYYVQQKNMALYFHFDKPIMNSPENRLLLSVGPAPNTMYFGREPESVRYQLQAAASDDLKSIVWVGDLGEVTSAQLVDVVLEQLTTYYLDHKQD